MGAEKRGGRRPAYDDRFFGKRRDATLRSARAIVPLVVELVGPRSVVDVGCARGEWLSVFRGLGVEDVFGVDGSDAPEVPLAIPAERFARCDLAGGIRLGRRFDLAVSLEVAEHLPAEHADGFVAALVSLAPVVLFSAAIPHQGGTGHVNEQWPEYWSERFARHGYHPVDAIRPRIWRNRDISTWYRQNILVYASGDAIAGRPRLAEARRSTDPERLSVVLPEVYLKKARPSAKRLWKMLRRELARKWGRSGR